MTREASGALDSAHATREAGASWRRALPLTVLVLGALLALYWDTVRGLVTVWIDSDTYGHGFLVVPVSLFMIWRRRARLASIAPRPDARALPVLLVVSVAWLAAHQIGLQVAQELCLLLAIAAVVWALDGPEVTRRLAFPLAYLALAVPIWSLGIPVLQHYTAVASARALQEVGVPVLLEGYYISIPSGRFVVAEVCAGLRFLLATLCVAALYVDLNLRSVRRGALLIAAALVLAIVFNWIRVIAIIALGHVTEMQHPMVRQHIGFGWVMFLVSLVPLFALGWWLQREPDGAGDAAAGASRGRRDEPAAPAGAWRVPSSAAAALVLIALGPALAAYGDARSRAASAAVELAAPAGVGAWSGPAPQREPWDPQFPDADATFGADYVRGADRVSLYLAVYRSQSDQRELVNERNSVYDPERWGRSARVEVPVPLAGARPGRVLEVSMRRPAHGHRLVWHTYYVGGRYVTSGWLAKLYQLRGVLAGTTGGAVVAVSTRVEGGERSARERLRAFLAEMGPAVEAALAAAPGTG